MYVCMYVCMYVLDEFAGKKEKILHIIKFLF